MVLHRALLLVVWLLPAGTLVAQQGVFARPVPEGGGPTAILCTLGVLDIDGISDADQNFTANVFLRATWLDPREAHRGDGPLLKKLDQVWHPHLLFVNKQFAQTSLDDTVVVSPEGWVTFRQQFWGTFSQPLKLHDYPFDSQECELRIASAGPEAFGELKMIQNPDEPSFVLETYSVANWELTGHEVGGEALTLTTGQQVASFALAFGMERLSTHYLIKDLAPLLMIIILSWIVFWLDPKNSGQLGVAITSFLTVIAYHIALGAKLPEISYLTRFDIFVFGATLMVFLAVIEVLVTTRLAKNDYIERAMKLDRICRVAFPVTLVLLVLYALVWF